jgi:hypothetical protein
LISSQQECEKARQELDYLRAWLARLANDTSAARMGLTVLSVRSMIGRISQEIADYRAAHDTTVRDG